MRVPIGDHACERVPFANERQLQRFFIANAARLFGLRVLASTVPDGRPLYKIDALAIDQSDRVHIVELKWNAIDRIAVDELRRYNDAIMANWKIEVACRILKS